MLGNVTLLTSGLLLAHSAHLAHITAVLDAAPSFGIEIGSAHHCMCNERMLLH